MASYTKPKKIPYPKTTSSGSAGPPPNPEAGRRGPAKEPNPKPRKGAKRLHGKDAVVASATRYLTKSKKNPKMKPTEGQKYKKRRGY